MLTAAALLVPNPYVAFTLVALAAFSDGATIGVNDDWQSSADAATISAKGFAPSDPRESAIYATLPPGAYGAILSGVNGATGTALVEVYAVQ